MENATRSKFLMGWLNLSIQEQPNAQSQNNSEICFSPYSINSKGIIFDDNLFQYSVPILLLELALISLITLTIQVILKPLGQISIISQILGGIILGPSLLSQSHAFVTHVFPPQGWMILNLISMFGHMFFQILVGVKMDVKMLTKSGTEVIATGVLAYVFPILIGTGLANLLGSSFNMDKNMRDSLRSIADIHSQSSFHVITCFLSELKILNSELGRIALTASMLTTLFNWAMKLYHITIDLKNQALDILAWSVVSSLLVVIISMYSTHRLALRAIRQTPEGKPVNESYIFAIITLILACSFISQCIGHEFYAAAFFLGLVIPDGPPLGSALEERLEPIVSAIFLPIFFTISGLRMDVFAIKNFKLVCIVELLVVVSFLAKTIGTMLAPLIYKMPLQDAFSLALIMNSKGIIDLSKHLEMTLAHIFDLEMYSIMVLNVLVITGVVSPLVRYLYDPSRRYLTYKRRTILHNGHDTELGILACVHNQDNVSSIIKLLEASNPSKQSPINVFVLHLVEMVGRNAPLLITHRRNNKAEDSAKPSQSEPIIKVFRRYEQTNKGIVSVDAFTSISPFVTMHDDVCWLALEQRTSLIIIPFHKQWLMTGTVEISAAIRSLNSNVIDKAPCSVGILIDHHNLDLISSTDEGKKISSSYNVGVLFFGGADDQEALSYATRMVEQPNIRLTVIRFCPKDIISDNMRVRMLDNEILSNFRLITLQNDRVRYKDEEVRDGGGVVNTIRSMENAYDLVMVGRRHEESPLTVGLTDWTEYPELGIIGDILAAPDFKGVPSILVVQQAQVQGMPQRTIESQVNY